MQKESVTTLSTHESREAKATAIEQAVLHWQRFYRSLDDTEKRVLDRAAAGHKIKVVCYEESVPYDTLQKRFKRWQVQLGLPSLTALLHMWRMARMAQEDGKSNNATAAQAAPQDEPALMRYAPEIALESALRELPGYKEVRLPEVLRQRAIAPHAIGSNLRRREERAELLAECVMSPALWQALLAVGQEVGTTGLRAAMVPMQHHLFLQMLGASDGAATNTANASSDRTAEFLRSISAYEFMGLGHGGGAVPLALPIAVTARALGLLRPHALSEGELSLTRSSPSQKKSFWEARAKRQQYAAYSAHNDIALWQRFVAGLRDEATLTEVLRGVTLDTVLGPLTGMAVSIAVCSNRFSDLSDRFAKSYDVIVRARLRHAQQLGVQPLRMLSYFSLEAAGIPAHQTMVQLAPEEAILLETAPSAVPRVRWPRRTERRESFISVATMEPFDLMADTLS